MKITENKTEMIKYGKQFVKENPGLYPQEYFDEFIETFNEYFDTIDELIEIFYCAVYCQQIYGTSIEEYKTFDFAHKTHKEKMQYITYYGCLNYYSLLNDKRSYKIFKNKYETYNLLKPYYRREAMILNDENDFDEFCKFIKKYKSIFVKPLSMQKSIGVHRLAINENDDLKQIFNSLLDEAKNLKPDNTFEKIDHKLILEEEIMQANEIAQFNPYEMSILRVTTILIDGKVKFFYPVFKIMCGDGVDKIGEFYSILALIDAETGIVTTDGINGLYTYQNHPATGTKIKGFQMPEWDKLKNMLIEVALRFPSAKYIGWDVAYSQKGWCIIEGNSGGEFFSQMCLNHGYKKEFEKLVGIHIPFCYYKKYIPEIQRKNKYNKHYHSFIIGKYHFKINEGIILNVANSCVTKFYNILHR